MNKLPMIARYALGLIFFVFGLNGFLNFIPQPPPPENLMTFVTGLMASKYFFPFLKGTEVLCGLMLLANRFVPLALVILAPIVLNIFLVHAFLAPEGLILAVIIGVLEAYLAFCVEPYKGVIKQLFVAR